MHDYSPPQSSVARLTAHDQRDDAIHLVPSPGRPITPSDLRGLLADLRDRGIRSIRTSALTTTEATPFVAAGFGNCGRLAMLSCPLNRSRRDLWRRDTGLRRGRRRDFDPILDLDRRCFPEPWRFDPGLLNDALEATPLNRFRVTTGPTPAGYAIVGIASVTAYLQRLAVSVDHQRQGLGQALVNDGRQWAIRRGATSMMVNTAIDNVGALSFYESLGFIRSAVSLVVMELTLDD